MPNRHQQQRYCRAHYTDLATFRNMDDIRSVTRPAYTYAWIGLFDDPASWKQITTDSNSWRWSATGTANTSQYTGWFTGHPNNGGAGESCVYIYGGKWNDYPCHVKLYFACYKSKY
uniref:C-type lectin domain-containing protein n=1 Tax=Neogobius melanostomus TaxID=47308 RepID=A0A8C6USC3_9GOBI